MLRRFNEGLQSLLNHKEYINIPKKIQCLFLN